MMSIRADSLATHGAEGRNGGDVRLGDYVNLDLDGNIATEEKETTLRRKMSDQAKELLVKWVNESQGNPNYIFDCCWCRGGTYEGDIMPYHHDWCPYGFIKSLAIAEVQAGGK